MLGVIMDSLLFVNFGVRCISIYDAKCIGDKYEVGKYSKKRTMRKRNDKEKLILQSIVM